MRESYIDKTNQKRVSHKYYPDTLSAIRATRLVEVLVEQIARIHSVKDWSDKANCPVSSLIRTVRNTYDLTPKEILKEVRYEKVIQILNQVPEAGAYSVAIDSGFTSEDALRMFLRRWHNTNFRTLQREVLSGELRMEWKWLNEDF